MAWTHCLICLKSVELDEDLVPENVVYKLKCGHTVNIETGECRP